jgi:hypothetical protein
MRMWVPYLARRPLPPVTHTPLFAAQSQSIPDDLVALLGQCRSSNCSAGTTRSAVVKIWRAAGFGWIADLHQSRSERLEIAPVSRHFRTEVLLGFDTFSPDMALAQYAEIMSW